MKSGGKPGTPPYKRVTLSEARHVRAELAKLYREARQGKVDVTDASKLANMLQILYRIIEGSDLEKRLEEIEKEVREYEQDKRYR
jgi:predicted transcriptional regulator